MKYAAEMFGTFVLVFAGVGTAVIAGGQVGNVGVAFAFGLALMAMAFALGPVSGCHINPAVSFGMWLSKRMSLGEMFGYWIAQAVGAIVASGVILFISKGAAYGAGGYSSAVSALAGAANGFGEHSPGHYTMASSFVAEMFLTMLLVLTVLGSTDKRAPEGFAGIPIGLILTAMILCGIPVTNGSFNPARSIGPAVLVGGWALEQLWLFIVAPLAGGLLASRIYVGVKAS
jgi:aquaporin Z